ncbi:MAG: hypothetical protein VR77_02305 [Flavobacteriales bacterium BRH_c54]|nr:MAG: hypothetical protein VR77_02305 [Flavobacteriales bacterium BRH_c54]
MKLENQTLLVISNEPWGDIWYSKHNWAYELSKKNKVFFINPPIKWKISNLWSFKICIDDYSESLQVLGYQNILPFTRFSLIYKLNNFIVSKKIKKWLLNNNYKRYIFWTFDPYRFSNPQFFSPLFSIYFRVDKYRVQKEKILLKNIDKLVVTSKELLKDIIFKGSVLELSHGISSEEFVPTNTINYEKGYFLYVGNIDHRLNIKLIDRILQEFPNERFVFIGKMYNLFTELSQDIFYKNKYKNLIIHGVEHFKNLKNYIYYSKACLVPMDLKIHGNAVHHHKTLQYLALGKPIISPIFNDVINKEEYIISYKNDDEAIEKIKQLSHVETNEKVVQRIQFAKQFTYEKLIEKVEQFLT